MTDAVEENVPHGVPDVTLTDLQRECLIEAAGGTVSARLMDTVKWIVREQNDAYRRELHEDLELNRAIGEYSDD